MNLNEALKILEIQSDFLTIEEIKRCYRKQQLQWHPDLHIGKDTLSEAVKKSTEINIAYEILTEIYEQTGSKKITIHEKGKNYSASHRFAKTTFTPGFPDESVFEIFVKSSNIVSIGYNPHSQVLYIKFQDNLVYMYFNVPNSIFNDFINAPSYGKYGHRNIYYSFEYRRCTEPNRPYSGPELYNTEKNRFYLTDS